MGSSKSKPKNKDNAYASKKLQDPNYKGEPMEDKYHEGPEPNRSCTDLFCCILFIAFIGGMAVVAYFGLERGDPYRLFCPFNSYAVQCGFKNLTVDTTPYTYLYFPGTLTNLLHLSSIADSVCIESCPPADADLTKLNCYSNVEGPCNTIINGNPTTPSYGSSGLFKRFCIPLDLSLIHI